MQSTVQPILLQENLLESSRVPGTHSNPLDHADEVFVGITPKVLWRSPSPDALADHMVQHVALDSENERLGVMQLGCQISPEQCPQICHRPDELEH